MAAWVAKMVEMVEADWELSFMVNVERLKIFGVRYEVPKRTGFTPGRQSVAALKSCVCHNHGQIM
jgi:hypothetical protein